MSKKVFIGISIIFILIVFFFVFDIYTKTTPPWEKRKNKTLIEQEKVIK